MKLSDLPLVVREDCPPDMVYLLPHGSMTRDLVTGQTVQLAPGYYVNPKQLAALKVKP